MPFPKRTKEELKRMKDALYKCLVESPPMKILDYNMDDPIPTSCAPWGSMNFPNNPTATEVDMRKEELYNNWVIKEMIDDSVKLEPCQNKYIQEMEDILRKNSVKGPYTLLGHTNDQAQQKQKENDMCYNTKSSAAVATVQVMPDRSDDEKREHLRGQLREALYDKEREAEKFFHLYVDNSPKNFRELIAAIKDGKFQIDEKRAAKVDAKILNDESFYGSAFDGIIWDGPQPDRDGYKAFTKFLENEFQKAKDEIVVLDLEKGLEALRRFQALEVAAKA